MKLSPVFVVLFIVVTTVLIVELPKKQRIAIDVSVEQDYSMPECLHDECFRDTPSADELNDITFSKR